MKAIRQDVPDEIADQVDHFTNRLIVNGGQYTGGEKKFMPEFDLSELEFDRSEVVGRMAELLEVSSDYVDSRLGDMLAFASDPNVFLIK